MRRTTVVLSMAALLPIAAAAGAAMAADHGHINDVTGDANGTDPRFAGGPAPADLQTGVASVPSLDITGADISSAGAVVHLLKAEPAVPERFVVTLKTPKCSKVTLEWETGWDATLLSGCRRIQELRLRAGHYAGNDVVLPLPTIRPSWLPSGTTVSKLSVQTAGVVHVTDVGEIWPPGDYATGSVNVTI